MKKQYTKPTMESEAFVANEYIASCWLVICQNNPDDFFTTKKKPNPDIKDRDGDGFTAGLKPFGTFYKGDQFNHDGHDYLDEWADGQHRVDYHEINEDTYHQYSDYVDNANAS